ncbi:MAG TPA: SsrA-binding protein SmpB [Bacteroidota bacterium]|nr:SsrA-binding protein SmpB [Bacteroidota bacterium]
MEIEENQQEVKIIATNKKANYEYFILERFEAGIVLKGTEVKSARNRNINLQDSYATIEGGEVILHNMHISPYEQGNIFNTDPKRDRKLLLHKKQIRKLYSKLQDKGLTLIPTKVYFSGKNLKVEIALAKGKKSFDKRESIAKRDAERQMHRKEY